MEKTQEIITDEDITQLLDKFPEIPSIPSLVLKMAVRRNLNVIKTFQDQIDDYENRLSTEEMDIIKKVIDMPIDDIMEILDRAYKKTNIKQLKILADPKAKPFIEKNLPELKNALF